MELGPQTLLGRAQLKAADTIILFTWERAGVVAGASPWRCANACSMKRSSRVLQVSKANKELQQCWTIALKLVSGTLPGRWCWVPNRMDMRRMDVWVNAVLWEDRWFETDMVKDVREAEEAELPSEPSTPSGSKTKRANTADAMRSVTSADCRPSPCVPSKNMAICAQHASTHRHQHAAYQYISTTIRASVI